MSATSAGCWLLPGPPRCAPAHAQHGHPLRFMVMMSATVCGLCLVSKEAA
jgi:hypothetical protein